MHRARCISAWRRYCMMITTATYAAILLWATHAPNIKPPSVGRDLVPVDKFWHFVAYALLALLVVLTNASLGRRRMPVLMVGAVLFVLAGFDEVTQPFTQRDAEWADWYADVAGIACGICFAAVVFPVATRRKAELTR